MDLHLKDKVILISGGASGIGEAVVRGAIDENAYPVIVDRDAERGERLTSELQEKGTRCLFLPTDLGEISQCQSAIDATVKEFGRIDVIVNNAGSNDGVGLENSSPQKFMASVQGNLLHYYTLVHFALSYLKESRGSIINVASKTAVTGQGGTSGYVAAKGAQLALTREWAVDLLPYGVRVNAVIPAEVMTPMYKKWLDTFDAPEDQKTSIENRIPLEKRMTTPHEIADTILFLASERASHTTGQYLFPDGGYTHLDRAISN